MEANMSEIQKTRDHVIEKKESASFQNLSFEPAGQITMKDVIGLENSDAFFNEQKAIFKSQRTFVIKSGADELTVNYRNGASLTELRDYLKKNRGNEIGIQDDAGVQIVTKNNDVLSGVDEDTFLLKDDCIIEFTKRFGRKGAFE
jgi:hypothetical protein